MPKKYPQQQKLDALMYLAMHNNINTTHQLTGIPTRTLRRWRAELEQQNNPVSSEKTLSSDTKQSQNTRNGHKHSESGQKTQKRSHNPTINSVSSHNHDIKNDEIPENGHKRGTDNIDDGLPDKTYPYPIEEDQHANTDQFEDFKNLRDKLMQHAQKLAGDLTTHDENINLRTLALARILDRIMQLDAIIPQMNPNQVIRFEFLYDGSVHNVPPWHNPPQDDNPP